MTLAFDAVTELDAARAEIRRLTQLLDDEPDSTKMLRELYLLICGYHNHAVDGDHSAVIANLGSLLMKAGESIHAMSREIGHYATAEYDARCQRDELLVERDELRDEVAELRAQLHDAALALNAQIDLVHEQDAELARLRAGVL